MESRLREIERTVPRLPTSFVIKMGRTFSKIGMRFSQAEKPNARLSHVTSLGKVRYLSLI